MQCVILAGGLATRMLPATRDIPKALLPVAGEPFAAHHLRMLRQRGVDEVVYCIGHLGTLIREHVGDGGRFGLAVTYVDEGTDLRGTGGALRLTADAGMLRDRFLTTYGDTLLPIDYVEVERAFVDSRSPALMTVFRNDGRWIPSNAVLTDGWVTLYDKDPAAATGAMKWVDYGMTMLTRELVCTEIPTGEFVDLSDVLRRLSRAGRLAGVEVHERFYEIGSPEGLRMTEDYLTDVTRP